jgi:serine/threonine protein kinase
VLGICNEPEHYAIVLEYLSGGSLWDYLKKQKEPLPIPRVIELINGISAGMLHLVRMKELQLIDSIQKRLFTEIWQQETFC